jgi:hypothetical protein
MTSSLHHPSVSRVLQRLHTESDSNDPPLLARMGDKTDNEMAELLNEAFIPVSPEAGLRAHWWVARGMANIDTVGH